MPKPKLILSTGLVLMPAIILVAAHSSLAESTDTCRSSPGPAAPAGLHWYYRVDRSSNRHCWYLHAQGAPVHASRNVPSRTFSEETTADRADFALQLGVPEPALQQPNGLTRVEGAAPQSSMPDSSALAFAARWVDLPKSVDLERRELAAPTIGYATEQPTLKAEDETPSNWAGIPAVNTGIQPRGAAQSNFGSISLAGALLLALLLLSEGLVKFLGTIAWTRALKWRPRSWRPLSWRAPSWETVKSESIAPGAAHMSHPQAGAAESASGLDDLRGVLRRANADLQPPRSFAPSRSSSSRKPTSVPAAQYFGRIRKHVRAQSAFQRLKTPSFSSPKWAPL